MQLLNSLLLRSARDSCVCHGQIHHSPILEIWRNAAAPFSTSVLTRTFTLAFLHDRNFVVLVYENCLNLNGLASHFRASSHCAEAEW